MKVKKIIEVLEFLHKYCGNNRSCMECYFFHKHYKSCLLSESMQFSERYIENIKENLKDVVNLEVE